ncbi:MAG: diguanylate cyclase domain [Acidimicrobiales bacterium]|nr:diguanylate cyclase domain [Acidimicrobiales bacterium]
MGDENVADRHADDIAALHAVASLAPGEPDDRLSLLLEAGCAALGADQGMVLLRTGSELVVRVAAGPKRDGLEPGQAVRDRRVADVLVRQVTVATLGGPAASDEGEQLGAGALVACPLWITGRVAGAIAFTAGMDHQPFSSWQLAVVDLVADGASRVLEREADIRALVRLESQAQAMISVIPDPVVRLHRDGRRVSDDGSKVLGVFDPCAGSRPSGTTVDEATVERVRAAVALALDTGELQTDIYAAGPGPLARRMEARYVPSGPDEVLCIVRDITERHRAEVALAEQVAFEALAASISTQLIGCAPNKLDDAIELGLGEIATFFAADVAYIDELSADGSTLRVSHQWSRHPSFQRRRRGDVVDVAGFGWLTARFERAGHVFARGPGALPPEATVVALGTNGDRGGLWVRLGYGGELVGVLGLSWRQHEPPETDEVLGLVRFAADAFLGAIRRRSVALLADGQAEVFELIARGAPLATALLGAGSLLRRHTLGATVLIATVDDDSRLSLVTEDEDDGNSPDWATWFSAVDPDLTNPFGQAVVTGEPVTVADVAGDPRFDPGALPPGGFRSATILPVRSPRNGRTLAVVAMLGIEPGAPQARSAVRDTVRSLVTVAVERWIDERRLAYQATHDPLTGVGNRAALLDRLELALARSRRSDRAVAVLFCDLDAFKSVNDRYGHDRGDRLLVEVSSRISTAVRPSDTVCRTGGDEFVVVCEDLHDGEQAQAIAERVRVAIASVPVDIGETLLPVTMSVGVAVADLSVDDPDRLLRTADLAMYAAKERRRQAEAPRPRATVDIDLVSDDPSLDDLARDLADALDEGALTLAHQPLVGRDGSLVGVEALVQWTHPTLGPMAAERILEASAVDLALASRLGAWVRRTGLAERAAWVGELGRTSPAPLHVNVSGAELASDAFVEQVLADAGGAGVDFDALVLEVAERDLTEQAARGAVARLSRAGIAILVEDAGLGGMPLPDLADLAVRGIKLSRSIVARIAEDDPLGVEVVRSLVLLAHGLGWRSVGVGVDTDHQRSVLFGFGVHAVQGRAVSLPVSAEDLRSWLARRAAH